MSQLVECILKVILLVAVIAILISLARGQRAWLVRYRTRILQSFVVLGVAAYVNFGGFHTDGSPLHVWDQYHYFIGSKYFHELRYDGLYVATLQARRERQPEVELPERVRDLRTGQLVPLSTVADHTLEVRQRFSDEQWERFSDDALRFYLQDDIFLDNGLKATPTHVQVLRLFSSWQPFRTRSMLLAASLDFILLGLAGFAIYRAFGLSVLAAASLIFGFGFCSRYYWVGGAFMRHDWLAALLIAAAALQLQRFRIAGVAIAYATVVRVFPILFIVPLLVFWFAQRRRGEDTRPAFEVCITFAVSLVLLIAVGWIAEPWAWANSVSGLIAHSRIIFPSSVGLRIPFITSAENFRGELVNPATLYDYVAITQDYLRLQSERLWLIVIAMLAMVAFTLRAAWRAPNAVAAFSLGAALVFALTAPTCYYGTFFVLLAFVRPIRTAITFSIAALLCFLVAALVFALAQFGCMTLNGAAIFGPASAILALAMIDWLRSFPAHPAYDAPGLRQSKSEAALSS
jgi:Glycosyltransferase family 87